MPAPPLVYISYSSHKSWKECPKQYKYSKIDKEPVTKDESRQAYNYLFGNVVHEIIGFFYNSYIVNGELKVREELFPELEKEYPEQWELIKAQEDEYKALQLKIELFARYREKHDIHKLSSLDVYKKEVLETWLPHLIYKLQIIFEEESVGIKFGIKYQPRTREEYLKYCQDGFQTAFKTILKERMFGKYAESEVKLVRYGDGVKITGYIDLLIIRKNDAGEEEYLIFDFKSSETNVNTNDQLLYYNTLLRVKFGQVKIRTFFFFIREGKTKEVIFPNDDQIRLWKEILHMRDQVILGGFPATPDKSHCFWCGYSNVCKEGQAIIAPEKEKEKELLESDSSTTFQPW